MRQDQVDQWGAMMRTHLTGLGYWQAHTLALSSLGMVVARHSAPSRVAEKWGVRQSGPWATSIRAIFSERPYRLGGVVPPMDTLGLATLHGRTHKFVRR